MGNKNSGPRPKPSALKVLRGERKDRINAFEPTPPVGDVVPPDGLSLAARKVWDFVAPVCLFMGTLTTSDVKAFAAYCELQATFDRACQEKDTEGFTPFLMTSITDSAGNEHLKVQEHPAIKLERNTANALRPYYEKFGLEPVGRARIQVPKKPQQENKWAGVLA